MISKQRIEYLVRKRDPFLADEEVDSRVKKLLDDISNKRYDFSHYSKDVFTQQGKKRVIFSYPKLSCEDILCQYLKKQLDLTFHVKYSSRTRIINLLFNVLPVVKDMNDFVIVRADFKSFFDSVLVQYVYDNYIKDSLLKRNEKELLETYAKEFKYCYAGLCLSNGMTEIVCRDFDERIRAKLSQYGMFFYERYVDDILLIMNKFISKDKLLELMNSTVQEVFGNCPVKLATAPGKFSYISKRNMSEESSETLSFLGYEFEIKNIKIGNKKRITFRYGITEKKRKKYRGIIERAIIQYSKDNNIELLRQRIKIFSARVVIGSTIGSNTFNWFTKGVVANYNELQHHMNALMPATERFLRETYFKLFEDHNVSVPYFMIQSGKEESIYSLYSNMKRNRTIILQEDIGVSRNTLVNWIKRIDPYYSENEKDYSHIVVDYLNMIKIK